MATRALICGLIFLAACIVFVCTSGASVEVKSSVVGSWLLVVTALGAIGWWPGIRISIRIPLLIVAMTIGAWFLTYAAARVVGNFEMSVRSVGAYLITEIVLVLSLYGLTRIVEMAVARIREGNRLQRNEVNE